MFQIRAFDRNLKEKKNNRKPGREMATVTRVFQHVARFWGVVFGNAVICTEKKTRHFSNHHAKFKFWGWSEQQFTSKVCCCSNQLRSSLGFHFAGHGLANEIDYVSKVDEVHL